MTFGIPGLKIRLAGFAGGDFSKGDCADSMLLETTLLSPCGALDSLTSWRLFPIVLASGAAGFDGALLMPIALTTITNKLLLKTI